MGPHMTLWAPNATPGHYNHMDYQLADHIYYDLTSLHVQSKKKCSTGTSWFNIAETKNSLPSRNKQQIKEHRVDNLHFGIVGPQPSVKQWDIIPLSIMKTNTLFCLIIISKSHLSLPTFHSLDILMNYMDTPQWTVNRDHHTMQFSFDSSHLLCFTAVRQDGQVFQKLSSKQTFSQPINQKVYQFSYQWDHKNAKDKHLTALK